MTVENKDTTERPLEIPPGVPDFPSDNLSPCYMSEGTYWNITPQHGLVIGVLVTCSGIISFVPVLLKSMEISSLWVCLDIDAFSESAMYLLRLKYLDTDERVHEQITGMRTAHQGRIYFEIPKEHAKGGTWFSCSLEITLATPMPEEERDVAVSSGMENPMEPILLRGVWLEYKS